MDSMIGICIENKKLSTIAEVTEFGTFLSTECSNDAPQDKHHQSTDDANNQSTTSKPGDITVAMEKELLSNLHDIKLRLINDYDKSFEQFFENFLQKHNLDKEIFAQVKKRHMAKIDEIFSATLDKILDKPEIQEKWNNILALESSLTMNPEFSVQIAPLRQEHCSQVKEVKGKITESRNSAYTQLESNLASIRGNVVKNKEVELLKKLDKLLFSLPNRMEIGQNEASK